MDDAAAVHTDTHETPLRPPPPEAVPALDLRRRPKAKRSARYTVTVRCEDERQQAMLTEWLAEKGFDVEGQTP